MGGRVSREWIERRSGEGQKARGCHCLFSEWRGVGERVVNWMMPLRTLPARLVINKRDVCKTKKDETKTIAQKQLQRDQSSSKCAVAEQRGEGGASKP